MNDLLKEWEALNDALNTIRSDKQQAAEGMAYITAAEHRVKEREILQKGETIWMKIKTNYPHQIQNELIQKYLTNFQLNYEEQIMRLKDKQSILKNEMQAYDTQKNIALKKDDFKQANELRNKIKKTTEALIHIEYQIRSIHKKQQDEMG